VGGAVGLSSMMEKNDIDWLWNVRRRPVGYAGNHGRQLRISRTGGFPNSNRPCSPYASFGNISQCPP
jgi:hypothetical protein